MIRVDKKAFTLPADIFATIGVFVLLIIYFFFMLSSGFSLNAGNIISEDFQASGSFNLYSYLNTPVDDSKMEDLLIEYANSGFADVNLEQKIRDESKEILRKLNYCFDDRIYFNVISIKRDLIGGEDFIVSYPDSKSVYDYYESYEKNSFVYNIKANQRLPYDGGFFWVTFFQSSVWEHQIANKINCEVVLR